MNQRTRKLMTMHKALHPRYDVDRLYVSRKEGGRGLASIEDTVDASIQRLEDYIEKHERGLITTIRVDTDNTINERMTTTRKQKWEGKQLYGRFKRLINNISHQKTLTWRICKIVDFAVPADHRINVKEGEKKDKYLDLVSELKKLWNMKVNDCANCDWCVRHSN